MPIQMSMNNKAAAVANAWDALCVVSREERARLRDAIRFYIAELTEVDAAIVELFEEVEICSDVQDEERPKRR